MMVTTAIVRRSARTSHAASGMVVAAGASSGSGGGEGHIPKQHAGPGWAAHARAAVTIRQRPPVRALSRDRERAGRHVRSVRRAAGRRGPDALRGLHRIRPRQRQCQGGGDRPGADRLARLHEPPWLILAWGFGAGPHR
jgi:hypothetical protein